MNYPLLIAPTLPEAERFRRDLFGHTAAKCRYLAGDDENLELKVQGYLDTTIFIYELGNTLYTEYFMEEILPMLEVGNRIYSVVPN